MKKGWKIIIIASLTIMLVSGCALNTGVRVYNNEKALAADYSSYNLINFSSSQSGNTVSGSAEKLEGMDTIWKYDADELTEVNISFSLTVTSGKAKLVYVDPDGTVSTLLECSTGENAGQSESETLKVKEGENRIRLVGAEGTGLEYEFTADKGEVETFGD